MEHHHHRYLRPRRPRGRSGFTLLELVAVIGIIALMSVVVVGGFNGIMRAISDTSGTDAMRRALMLARQQACVDGEDTYVWVTDMNKFAVVRKAGTVTASTSGARKPSYLQVGGREKSVSAKWIEDGYADLASATQSFVIDDNSTADDIDEIVNHYKGIKVFDMATAKMADITVPPWFDGSKDAWVFGIDSSAPGFAAGADYGWLIYPEQTLPAGYVFADSYDSTGEFKESYNKKVHFLVDGTVESAVVFPIYEVSVKKTRNVSVDGSGKVTIATTSN
jgi:prepilin-type N-terminal cleavage/methylation domain-containing protein